VSRRPAYVLVAAVCALPRLAIVLHERAAILENMEKSSTIAQVYLRTGTFGYVPGHPTAYTQPLYGWFLIGVYWLDGERWWSLGLIQTLVAVATALLVLEVGRRVLGLRYGVLASLVTTLQPYLVWHDVHGNREILDQLLGAAMFLLVLLASNRRSLPLGVALGLVSGIAILSNARLVVLPLAFTAYLLWRGAGWASALVVPLVAALALVPWVIRNKVELGCYAITTDARALWKANNLNTYQTLASGLWLDEVPDIPQRRVRHIADRWRTSEEAGQIYASTGKVIDVPECFQQNYYEGLVESFWEHHPGAKVKLAVQATGMLWNPEVGTEGAVTPGVNSLRTWVEPLWTIPVYLLALVGLFVVPPAIRVLALVFVVYETAAAWVFAGTTRYRVSWDFVLVLLAAAALARVPWARLDPRRRGA
jgi:4-amino-4-deoxy-L-arabinose transferase-like glycosyltransferase